jgi:hypothetical protein
MAKELSADVEVTAAGSAGHRRPSSPAFLAAPLWVVGLTAASGAVFTYGLLVAFSRGPGPASISFTSGETVIYLMVATVGRLVAVVIQAGVVGGAAGPVGKLRAIRRGVLVGTFWSQVPLAIRDIGLGVAALVGLSGPSIVGLALNPFDPFMLVSVYMFYRFVRRLDLGDRNAMVRMIVTFTAYLTLIKLALFGLGAAL